MASKAKIADKEVNLTKQEVDADLPEEVTLAAAFGYYDADGALHYWAEAQVVREAATVEDLILRQAPLVGIEYEA